MLSTAMSDPEPTGANPKIVTETSQKKRPIMNWERAIAALALALSVTAILVSLLEVSTVRSHVKATVWPHLSLDTQTGSTGTAIQLKNKGVGPALVQDIVMTLDGKVMTNIETAIIDTIGAGKLLQDGTYTETDVINQVVAAGETIDIFAIRASVETDELMRIWSSQLDIQMCYCSIQEECWTTYLIAKTTVSTDQCDRTISGNVPTVSEKDFSAIIGKKWTGTLNYKDYSSDKQVSVLVNADVEKITSRTIIYRLEYPDEPDFNSVQRLRISRDGTRIDGIPIVRRERVDGRLEITTRQRSSDNNVPANIEYTYKLGPNQFDIAQMVIPDNGGAPFLRNQYMFSR